MTDQFGCCGKTGAGPGSGSSHCEVEWLLPDGTQGGDRLGGASDHTVVGSTIYVDGDKAYVSHSHIVRHALLPALSAVVAAFMLLVYIPVTSLRDRKGAPARILRRERERHFRQAR